MAVIDLLDLTKWVYKKYNVWIYAGCRSYENDENITLFIPQGKNVPVIKKNRNGKRHYTL